MLNSAKMDPGVFFANSSAMKYAYVLQAPHDPDLDHQDAVKGQPVGQIAEKFNTTRLKNLLVQDWPLTKTPRNMGVEYE